MPKLTPAQKEVIRKMRNGAILYVCNGIYNVGVRPVQVSTIQGLINKDIIIHTKFGQTLFELTNLGKSIQL